MFNCGGVGQFIKVKAVSTVSIGNAGSEDFLGDFKSLGSVSKYWEKRSKYVFPMSQFDLNIV